MAMDKHQRAEYVKNLAVNSEPSDAVKAKRIMQLLPKAIQAIRRNLKQIDLAFQTLSGATLAEKQTSFFTTIAAETDGALILHDLGQCLDVCLTLSNDFSQPDESALEIPFTDADVTAFLA